MQNMTLILKIVFASMFVFQNSMIVKAGAYPAPFSTLDHSHISAFITGLSPRALQIYQRSLWAGRNPHLFTIAGDSNSNSLRYLGRVTTGAFDISRFPELQKVADYFAPSFAHVSIAVGGGLSAADMFNVTHISEFDGCQPHEGTFSCELRLSNASIVFILLGTGDKFVWREYEANYRAMLDDAILKNVLPVLVTKADDLESLQGGASDGYINGVIRALAKEYQLPMIDLWAATRNLPVVANPALPHRPFTQFGLQDEWGYYFHLTDRGQDAHIELTLRMLSAVVPVPIPKSNPTSNSTPIHVNGKTNCKYQSYVLGFAFKC